MKLLLKGARVIDPSQKIDTQMDILIEDGKISFCGASIKAPPGHSDNSSQHDCRAVDRHDACTCANRAWNTKKPLPPVRPRLWQGVHPSPACPTRNLCMITVPLPNSSSEKRSANLARVYPIGADQYRFRGQTNDRILHLGEAGV